MPSGAAEVGDEHQPAARAGRASSASHRHSSHTVPSAAVAVAASCSKPSGTTPGRGRGLRGARRRRDRRWRHWGRGRAWTSAPIVVDVSAATVVVVDDRGRRGRARRRRCGSDCSEQPAASATASSIVTGPSRRVRLIRRRSVPIAGDLPTGCGCDQVIRPSGIGAGSGEGAVVLARVRQANGAVEDEVGAARTCGGGCCGGSGCT